GSDLVHAGFQLTTKPGSTREVAINAGWIMMRSTETHHGPTSCSSMIFSEDPFLLFRTMLGTKDANDRTTNK
ncbi:hypothetical protein, partial [Bradyrhizobium sp.]|uniref:hypothetical protein n=1 Tax=Bradyrhizobium sp. TaxID=376 RepID=UPI0029097878